VPFLQSSELGLPHPLTRRRVYSNSPLVLGGDTLACGRGGEGSQFGRGDRHCGTSGKHVVCDDMPKKRTQYSLDQRSDDQQETSTEQISRHLLYLTKDRLQYKKCSSDVLQSNHYVPHREKKDHVRVKWGIGLTFSLREIAGFKIILIDATEVDLELETKSYTYFSTDLR
jgi:hypothetical protein